MRARGILVALVLLLVAAAPATAARPGYSIPADQLPTDVATARAMLKQARSWAPRGTLTQKDVNYVLRLANKYLRPGVPARARRPSSARSS